jgi:hypothetical protein
VLVGAIDHVWIVEWHDLQRRPFLPGRRQIVERSSQRGCDRECDGHGRVRVVSLDLAQHRPADAARASEPFERPAALPAKRADLAREMVSERSSTPPGVRYTGGLILFSGHVRCIFQDGSSSIKEDN